MQTLLTTFADMAYYLLEYAGSDAQAKTLVDAKRAVVNGYREFNANFRWSYLYQRGRIATVAPYSTGTVTYTAATRRVVLAGGTWPSWAAFGSIFLPASVQNVLPATNPALTPCAVASVQDTQTLTLTSATAPAQDIATPTTFTLYRDVYPLPPDYQQGYDMIEFVTGNVCQFVPPNDWLQPQRNRTGPAKPVQFAVMADPHYFGTMGAFFYPQPDSTYTFDFIYHRRPRTLLLMEYVKGTVSVGIGSTTIAGVSTAWPNTLVGSTIRLAAQGDPGPPDGPYGAQPYAYERTVLSVTDANTLIVDAAIPVALNNVKYRISDPVDVEEGCCLTAFHRECERQMRLLKRMKPAGLDGGGALDEEEAWRMAYMQARAADKRSIGFRVAGGVVSYRRRLANMPIVFEA